MSKPRYPNRYTVAHSGIGSYDFDTLTEAKRFVQSIERHTSYCAIIWDNKKDIQVY